MSPYFSTSSFTLHHGNCNDVLNEYKENTFDMVFADPPYFLSDGSFTCQNGKMVPVKKGEWDMGRNLEANFDFHMKWLESCKRVLKPNGTLWVSSTYHSIYQIGFAIQRLGFHILNDITWFKPNAAPNLSCRFFTASHENLLWVRKSKQGKHTFNYQEMKNGDWKGDSIKKPNTQMRSVWSIGTPKMSEKAHGKHPTQKPEELLKRVILASTNVGDLVLDPFCGSSTTGIVANRLKRKYIGIDTSEVYLSLSKARYQALTNNILQ